MILGITAQNHDASMALIDGDKILWAAHSERYSRIKNDNCLNPIMVAEMMQYGEPEQIVWFERPWSKNFRRLFAGQRPWQIDPSDEIRRLHLDHLPISFVGHHESHAAAGYYTSGFADATILVVDAIGEWDSVSIWNAAGSRISKIWSKKYPDSIGLFYSAMTQRLGLKPNEEEYILMGMAAHGRPSVKEYLKKEFFKKFNAPDFKLRHNLHKGCMWWENLAGVSQYNIAASVQAIMEEYLLGTIHHLRTVSNSKNLVLMGGAALNCVANGLIAKQMQFDNIWIMPNPGDSGSAIGAVAAYTQTHLKWPGPFLGTDIKRNLDIDAVVKDLLAGHVVGVANGRAEFGPRALGNRSLLCDPRGKHAKDKMNAIKKREEFRPFAPAILAEHVHDYFDMPSAINESPYMSFVVRCKQPKLVPGVVHIDGTSRVQTVTTKDNPVFRKLLEAWHAASGCPMLMNTSLNIKGQPLVNTWDDALDFQNLHKVTVY